MSAEDPGSITRWLKGLKEGRPEAVDAIWQRYYQRVLAVARRRLRQGPHQAVEDGEDVALSALYALAAGAAQGQFDHLNDRSELWRILAAITAQRADRHRRWHGRQKRNGPMSSQGINGQDPAPDDLLALIAGRDPSPELAAILREQREQLLDALPDPILCQIAEWRIEGLTHAQIAAKLGCAVRTVERKVERIRQLWERIQEESNR
jgi:RNA polymerase sigma factor (sigma-70 family)